MSPRPGAGRSALVRAASAVGVATALAAAAPVGAAAGVAGATAVRPRVRAAADASAGADAGVGADVNALVVRERPGSGVARYWTAARMAAATSEDAGGKGVPARPAPQTAAGAAAAAARMPSAYLNGRPSIGVLFFRGRDLKSHFCTAFVVSGRTRNLLMMAAHCRPGSSQAFVPGYRIRGTTAAPYGIWPVLRSFTDRRFRTSGSGTDFDYAFAKVGRNAAGRQIEDVTHGNTLTRTPAYANRRVGVTGYPRASAAAPNRPITCWAPTRRLGRRRQLVFLCNGYYGGTSGSPWLIDYRARTNTGRVIGLIGGVGGGGPNAWTSYSPVFDGNTLALYRYALAH